MKRGLVVASFGTTHNEAYESAIKPIVMMAENNFSNIEVSEAFTSRIVNKVLRERDGKDVPDERTAVAKLIESGCDEIYIQPLHILGGHEYEKLKIDGTVLGSPLLESADDIARFAAEVDFGMDKDDALILMGHGSSHSAEWVYDGLEEEYRRLGYRKFYVATVEGAVTIDDILDDLSKKGIDEIYIRPLMLVAGEHAKVDMAGDEDDSWKNRLELNGIKVHPVLEGLGEIPAVRNLYFAKMQKLLGE